MTEPDKIHICQLMRISCAKSIGFVVRSKLPAIIAFVIQLSWLKFNSNKQASSELLKSLRLFSKK